MLISKKALTDWAKANGKPPAEILAMGKDAGRNIEISQETLDGIMLPVLRAKSRRTQIAITTNPPEPSVAELAGNFASAMGRWILAGAPVASQIQYYARAAICDSCPHWDGKARAGLGKCGVPGCGCTSMKRWLATEKCPLGKWPAV